MKKRDDNQTKEILVVLTILLIGFFITLGVYLVFSNKNPEIKPSEENIVTKVIDGDTFELRSGEKVRLICIDTPESGKEGYLESKEFLESLVLNKIVRLEEDVSKRDSYGRLLRYVYVNATDKNDCDEKQIQEDNSISANTCIGKEMTREVFVNKELVKKGYAEVFPYGNDTRRCSEIKGE